MSHLPAERRRVLSALTGAAFAAALTVTMVGSPAHAAEGAVLGAGAPNAVAGSYLVVLKEASVSAQAVGSTAQSLASRHGGKIAATYHAALRGFSAQLSEAAARRLAADPAVAYVQQDMVMSIDATQSPVPSWGLDRIDQRALPLNNSYTYPTVASGVTVYVIDTGVRITHADFGGRARHGRDTVSEDDDSTDCHGHGTHVAGTVGGTSFGVAKGVSIVGVRVLGCTGSGTTTDIVQGIDWVTANSPGPAVANMSLGGGVNTALDNAVANSIASGVTYAIAAGNSNINACNFSPARTPTAITLGATGTNDARASFSNFGTCLDLFAPGVAIVSAAIASDTATATLSGTSMASPHAAGVAALILAANAGFTPQQVRDRMVADATTGVVTGAGTGSPNLLLFVNNGGQQPPGTVVYQDLFESATGWTTNPNGTDTATTGTWERGDPEATSSGVALQPGTTVSGTNDLVTGRLAGASAGAGDVDGGTTTIQSPSITMPAGGTQTLTFSWYFAHLNNATAADFFRVSVVSGGNVTVVLNQAGSAANRAGAWAMASVNVSSFGGQTIQLRIETADAATASLVEAGVDDVIIVRQ
jgi:subtilisin family serine protease